MCAMRTRGSRRAFALTIAVVSLGMLAGIAGLASAQDIRAAADSRHAMLREAMLGVLHDQAEVRETTARQRCVTLPVEPPDDRLQGAHGSSLTESRCEVARFDSLGSSRAGEWFAAEYHWVSVFSAEDSARGAAARDTVSESEAVLFASMQSGRMRPIWHARIETGEHGVWRSVTPELAARESGILLSVQHCVNGTGGCSQEFLRRSAAGGWSPVWQAWVDQLPQGMAGRILHGVRIDVHTLRGEAGFYGPRDPNCCPAEMLRVVLSMRGDSLVLLHHAVVPANPVTH